MGNIFIYFDSLWRKLSGRRPSRAEIQSQIDLWTKEEFDQAIDLNPNTLDYKEKEQFCCVLWWDESVYPEKEDMPFTVTGPAMRDRLMKKYKANARPLLKGACK